MNSSRFNYRNKPDRFETDELGGLVMVSRFGGGGGSSTQFLQSPEAKELAAILKPVFESIYPRGAKPTTPDRSQFSDQESYDKAVETYNTQMQDWSSKPIASTDLYDIPALNIETPDIKRVDPAKYTPGGEQFQNVYDKIAPSLLQAYNQNVQNPLINRFSGSGSLGSPVAGVSGAAMKVLENSRRKAGNDISSQAFQLAQAPLLKAMDLQGQKRLTEYAGQSQAMADMAKMPWQAEVQKLQYPYQILPGILGGTMPTPVTTTSGGK